MVSGWNDQIFGDPEAADIVFTSGADILAVGINVTHQVVLTGDLCNLIYPYIWNIFSFVEWKQFIFSLGIDSDACLNVVDADREKLAQSNGKFAQYLCKILEVYFSYHRDAYNTKGLFIEMG